MENRNVMTPELENVGNRLYNFFSEMLERTPGDNSPGSTENDRKYQSLWEFWEKEL